MNYSARAGAGASPYAHLLSALTGGKAKAAAAVAAAEDEDEDGKDKAAAAAEDGDGEDDEDGKDKKSKKAKRAKADDDNDPDMAEDDDGEGDEDGKDKTSRKAKKAKAEDDNEEGGDDYEEGRKAERARWASVLKSPAASGGRLAAACEMLAGTGMSSKTIVRTLTALPVAPPAGVGGLQNRMSGVAQPRVGADGGAPSSEVDSFAAEMAAAAAAVRGAK
ncbi:MAG: hypothetical protein P4L73_19230 [Caulobacteraceae bacterium]|nr:hypothetical protein [Caulobacteraceae bacterium]